MSSREDDLAGPQAGGHLVGGKAVQVRDPARSRSQLAADDGGHHERSRRRARARSRAPRRPAATGAPRPRAGCSRARSSAPSAGWRRCPAGPGSRTGRGCGSARPRGAPARRPSSPRRARCATCSTSARERVAMRPMIAERAAPAVPGRRPAASGRRPAAPSQYTPGATRCARTRGPPEEPPGRWHGESACPRPARPGASTRRTNGVPGSAGGRTCPSASGAPSARTTAPTATRGTTSATTRPGRAPTAGARTGSPASPTTTAGCASSLALWNGPTRSSRSACSASRTARATTART